MTVDSESGLEQFNFTALDGTNRTDYWLPNAREVEELDSRGSIGRELEPGQQVRTDPWDPDTDDDGLTDGQELHGVTVTINGSSETYTTLPTEADSDGDNYWDGWIGVYNVTTENKQGIPALDNVILYRQNLQSGTGIDGDEIVQQQIGVHHVDEVASVVGADIDDDETKEHSNIHVGELQWDSNPEDESDTPTLGLSVEVDFAPGDPANLNTSTWETGIEENAALYGISLNIERDDTLDGPLENVGEGDGAGKWIDTANSLNNDLYVIVAGEVLSGLELHPDLDKFDDAWGFNVEATSDEYSQTNWLPNNGIILFENEISNAALGPNGVVSSKDIDQSPYVLKQEVVASQVFLHELGHSVTINEADNSAGRVPFSEVYNGGAADSTPEIVTIRGSNANIWNIMRSGWDGQSLIHERDTGYFVYSIEELLSAKEYNNDE